MARVRALPGVADLVCVLLLITGTCAAEQPEREPAPGADVRPTTSGYVLAKVSDDYCKDGATLSPSSDSSTSAQSVSVLSAAAIQAVTTVAAAAGLTFHKEVATDCWCLLAGAEKEEAMTAAIKALLQPSAEVMAATEAVFKYAGPESLYFVDATLPRKPAAASSSETIAATAAAAPKESANTINRLAQPSQQFLEGLPEECISGTCNSLWGMNRIRPPDLWRRLVDEGRLPLPQNGFLKGMVIDQGVDFQHNDMRRQIDITNSRTFYSNNGNQPPGGVAARGQSHGTHCMGTMAGDWSMYLEPNQDLRGIAGVVGAANNNIVS